MNKLVLTILVAFAITFSSNAVAQTIDSIMLKDIEWDPKAPAGMKELMIPSENNLLAGLIYLANGAQKNPTLILLHGFPGNERNLDLAQVMRAQGWNVVYFDYRGSWGSQGKFSFRNCVKDVVNVVSYCKSHQEELRIDTSNMALFGHSMGGWICLKALQQLPGIQKGFALSTWNIGADFKGVSNEVQLEARLKAMGPGYFVLNSSPKEIFSEVLKDSKYFNLENDAKALAAKQIILLDEHNGNKDLAAAIQSVHTASFDYQVWPTDHPFTNKRVALMKMVMEFLGK